MLIELAQDISNKHIPTYTDKGIVHSYIAVYDALFEPYKDRARNILEIGIEYGGSLRLWCSYFSNALITGIDTRDHLLGLDPRIRTFKCDAYTESTVNILSDRKYDIIIDDGSHTLEDQLFVMKNYIKLLNSPGLLIIEDIQKEEYIYELMDAVPLSLTQHVEVLDLRSLKGRYDDIFIKLEQPTMSRI